MSLSVCLIVRNEESRLARCLKSAAFAGEIVIADTGSVDGTAELARQFTSRVFSVPWTDDFSAARNAVLEKARGDWILSLDADETLPAGSESIIRQLTGKPSPPDGYLVRLQCHTGTPGGQSVEWGLQCRLFRNKPAIRFQGPVHEQIIGSIQKQHGAVEISPLVIEHHGYILDQADLMLKWERNLRILEQHLARFPDDSYSRYQLGRQLLLLGQPGRAETCLQETVRQVSDPFLLVPVLNDLSLLYFQYLRDGNRALEYAERSLKLMSGQTFPWLAKGMGHLALGNSAEALHSLQEAERRELAGRQPGLIASEIQVEAGRLSTAIFDLLPPGEEKENRRQLLRKQAGKNLPAEVLQLLEKTITGSGAMPVLQELLSRLPAMHRDHVMSNLRWLIPPSRQGEIAEAFLALIPSEEHGQPAPDALKNLLMVLLENKKILAARKLIPPLVQRLDRKFGPDAILKASAEIKQQGHSSLALAILEEGLRKYPANSPLNLAAGLELESQNRFGPACDHLQKALAAGLDHPALLLRLIKVALRAGQTTLAGEAWQHLKNLPGGKEAADRLALYVSVAGNTPSPGKDPGPVP